MKDLVDIAVYATTCEVDGSRLQRLVKREAAVRGIMLPEFFHVPDQWGASQARQFGKLCDQTGLPLEFQSLAVAEGIGKDLLDPAINGDVDGKTWEPNSRKWVDEQSEAK